jgi:hypothetical protein
MLDTTTVTFGKVVRRFQSETCKSFRTVESPREAAARARVQAQRAAASGTTVPGTTGRKAKEFNLQTYKFHAMGDYSATIKRFGTTDSYTTQIVRSQPLPLSTILILSDQ